MAQKNFEKVVCDLPSFLVTEKSMAVWRAMLKFLITEKKKKAPQNDLYRVPASRGHLAWNLTEIWLVLGWTAWVSKSCQYLLETDKVQIISNPDNTLHITCASPQLYESLMPRGGCCGDEGRMNTRNRRAPLMGEADIPASPYLLSINPGMVMQSFVTLGNLCLGYSPYYNIGLFFPVNYYSLALSKLKIL